MKDHAYKAKYIPQIKIVKSFRVAYVHITWLVGGGKLMLTGTVKANSKYVCCSAYDIDIDTSSLLCTTWWENKNFP